MEKLILLQFKRKLGKTMKITDQENSDELFNDYQP